MNDERIYGYIERIAALFKADVRRAGEGKSLQPVQLEALHYLSICNKYSNTPAAVAEYLGLTKGTVSQSLGLLEASQLIEKEIDKKDRRIVHLLLTERGRQLIANSIPPKRLKNAVDQLPEETQDSIVSALNELLRSLQRANELKTFGLCKTCRYNQVEANYAWRCGLTGERLYADEIQEICREHKPTATSPSREDALEIDDGTPS
jgi:DNA-binding MarR family transcriptional regulator